MEKIEQKEKRLIKINLIQKVILGSIITTGVLSVSLLALNAIHLLKWTSLDKQFKRSKLQIISRAKKELIKKGLLVVEDSLHGKVMRITELGKSALERELLITKRLNIKWDGKWRVIIFDIPEKRKLTRDKLRYSLISIGFIKIQNSVWVYPYPCEDLISLLKADFKIGKDVLYLIVDQLEGDSYLQERFNLKSPLK